MAEMYDAMSFEDEAAPTEEVEVEEEEAAPEMDGELAMHAEKLGFSAEQAEHLKAFVERCKTLGDEGAYVEEGAEEEDLEI
jgi:hypothetical protein